MKKLLFIFLPFLLLQIHNLKSETSYKSIWVLVVTEINSNTTKSNDAFRGTYFKGMAYETKEECQEGLDIILLEQSQSVNNGQVYGRKDKLGNIEMIYGNGAINYYTCVITGVKNKI